MNKDIEQVLESVISMGDEKKATDIRSYHFEEGEWIAEAVVIMSTSNDIHIRAMVETFKQELPPILKGHQSDFYDDPRVVGDLQSGWVILDLNSIFVHIVKEDLRSFYDLDKVFEQRAVVYHH